MLSLLKPRYLAFPTIFAASLTPFAQPMHFALSLKRVKDNKQDNGNVSSALVRASAKPPALTLSPEDIRARIQNGKDEL
jgi:hypothetical protein